MERGTIELLDAQVERDVISQIEGYNNFFGCGPTLEDLRRNLGLSSRGMAWGLVKKLKAKGLIDWQPGKSKTLKVVAPKLESLASPDRPESLSDTLKAYTSELHLRAERIGSDVLLDVVNELRAILSRMV